MACVLVPAAEAVITTIAGKVIRKKEKEAENLQLHAKATDIESVKIPFSRKLKWLSNLLWGGSALLIIEHVWHGEIVPFFPFLTAVESSAETAAMLREMATAGVSMTVLTTLVWVAMLAVVSGMEKKAAKTLMMKKGV